MEPTRRQFHMIYYAYREREKHNKDHTEGLHQDKQETGRQNWVNMYISA